MSIPSLPEPHAITREVLDRLANTPDERLRRIMTSLVEHLHAFARDVQLTEAEWFEGIRFLTRTGHATNEWRQEFILLSDTLGLSMLTVALNHDRTPGCTEATVFGPFHVEGAPELPLGADVAQGAQGLACAVTGTVRGVDGTPVTGAVIDVWQADAEGLYDVQRDGLEQHQARAVLRADAQGRFHFRTVLPVPYAIPDDGPVGDLLKATGRHPWRPAHLHFRVQAPGWRTLITHVFRRDDPYLESDAVFGVRPSLVADWPQQADGSHAVSVDIVLDRDPAGTAASA